MGRHFVPTVMALQGEPLETFIRVKYAEYIVHEELYVPLDLEIVKD